MKIGFYTLGCKVNQYDTQSLEYLFKNAGWEIADFESRCDAYVINTCTVTAMSDKKSRQIISRAHRRNPDAVIVVAGCMAQGEPEKTALLPGVSVVLGSAQRGNAVALVEKALSDGEKLNAAGAIEKEFSDLHCIASDHTRAQLKVQDGCNQFCSYCIIPYVRGRTRSRSVDSAVEEAREIACNGFKELVVTGIHLASYRDGEVRLAGLIEEISKVDGIQRIRLGSLEPCCIDESFINVCANEAKLCRQFHISLQSGSDAVLRRMNRKYTTAQYAASVDAIRDKMPDAAITTDIIAGFCGETEQEHAQTLDFMRRVQFSRVHVFPYSVRKGTAAEKMPGHLDNSVKEERARELIQAANELETRFIDSMLGKKELVLVEQDSEGYTRNYIKTKVEGGAACGKILPVLLTGRRAKTAVGKPC